MCGITGIYAFNMVGGFNMINISAATLALEKRGPDNHDIFNDDTVGLGHRRLAIIDTSEGGHQPMFDESGRYVIVFNGEIYNYQTLKHQLEAEGVSFKSQSDTEVLLYLYIKKGEECLQLINGFFTFAIYDKEKKSLFIARDRIGIKPLYYYVDEDKLLFASELKSLLAYGINKQIDHTSLFQYLQLNYITAPNTIIKGVEKLMPGQSLSIKEGKTYIKNYYQIPYNSESASRNETSYTAQKQQLTALLETAVKKRLVADVPLGTFLSGGIDSSVITALASKHKQGIHSFSIGFKDEKFFDETQYASLVAKHFKTEHTVFSLSNDDLYRHVHNILDYLDEPFADSSAIAVYILSRETRKYATVALSGDGADEIFQGITNTLRFIRSCKGAVKSIWSRPCPHCGAYCQSPGTIASPISSGNWTALARESG